jgi:hypothetical protein
MISIERKSEEWIMRGTINKGQGTRDMGREGFGQEIHV